VCKRRKEKRAQWEEDRAQIIRTATGRETELHLTMDRRERDNSLKRERNG